MEMLMDSKDRRDAGIDFTITASSGEVVDEFSISAEVNGPTLVTEEFRLPDGMGAGDYNIRASLRGTPVSRDFMFTVMPVHMVTESVRKTSTALYDDFEVTVINEGNVMEPRYVTYRSYPNNYWVTGLVTAPEDCFVSGGDKTCRYVFQDLAPGERVTLSYRLDYWSVYATYALILIAVFLTIFFAMRRMTAPVIVKKHARRGGKHHVVLEIRNPFRHTLSNAIVRDWVSPLANVLQHEIKMVRPLVRRSDAGTELIWKLGNIKPNETRIITYPVKALVQGSLKMPRAYIRYNKPSGRLRRLFSKPLIFDT
jgi:hypothetical protein